MLERIRHVLLRKRRQQVAWWDLVERAEDHLRALDEDNERDWRLSETRAAPDFAAGRISFTRADGSTVSADIQFAGIHGFTGGWVWAWDLPSIQRTLRLSADKVHEHGERQQLDRLTTPRFAATEIEAWGLTAVAVLLNRAGGAWRFRTPEGYL